MAEQIQNDTVDGERVRAEKGQTAVEFALVMSFLFLIVFGIVEFSRLFFAYATMSHGVREGARVGITHSNWEFAQLESEIQNVVQSRMVLIGGTATVTVTTPDEDPLQPGSDEYQCPHYCSVVVRAESRYNPWIPLLPGFDMVAQSKMHFE